METRLGMLEARKKGLLTLALPIALAINWSVCVQMLVTTALQLPSGEINGATLILTYN